MVITDVAGLHEVCARGIREANRMSPGAELQDEHFSFPNVRDGYKFCSANHEIEPLLLDEGRGRQMPYAPLVVEDVHVPIVEHNHHVLGRVRDVPGNLKRMHTGGGDDAAVGSELHSVHGGPRSRFDSSHSSSCSGSDEESQLAVIYDPLSAAFTTPPGTVVGADTPPDKYVTPNPGLVIKIKRPNNVKIFINLCSHDEVPLSTHQGVTLVSMGPKRTLPSSGDGSAYVYDALMAEAEDDTKTFTLPNTKGKYKSTADGADVGVRPDAVFAVNGAVVAPFLLRSPAYMVLKPDTVAVSEAVASTEETSDTASTKKTKSFRKSLSKKVSGFLRRGSQKASCGDTATPLEDKGNEMGDEAGGKLGPSNAPLEPGTVVVLPVPGVCMYAIDSDGAIFVNICSHSSVPETEAETETDVETEETGRNHTRKPVYLVGPPRFIESTRVIDVVRKKPIPRVDAELLKVSLRVLKILQTRGDVVAGDATKFTIVALADRVKFGLGASIYKNTTAEALAIKFHYMSSDAAGGVNPFRVPEEALLGKAHSPAARPPAPIASSTKLRGRHRSSSNVSAAAPANAEPGPRSHLKKEIYSSYYDSFEVHTDTCECSEQGSVHVAAAADGSQISTEADSVQAVTEVLEVPASLLSPRSVMAHMSTADAYALMAASYAPQESSTAAALAAPVTDGSGGDKGDMSYAQFASQYGKRPAIDNVQSLPS